MLDISTYSVVFVDHLFIFFFFIFHFNGKQNTATEAIQRGQQHLCQFKATRVPIMNGLNRRYRRLLVLHR